MRKLFALILLLLVAVNLSAQTDLPEVARALMEDAARERDAGRIDEAIEKYKRVLELVPRLATAYVQLGALQHKQGLIEDALATFARGVEKAPTDRTLLTNAAAAAQQLGRNAEALTYVDHALERNRKDAALHSLRATILRSLKREGDALAAIQQAVQLDPRDARYQFSLGNILYALDRKPEAIAAYRKSADLDKTFLRAYYNLGAVLFESGRYDEALAAYKVALAPVDQAFSNREPVETIHARAYANLGAIYLKQQQWQPAREAYLKALQLEPESASARYNLGFVSYSTNRFAEAETEYKKALALDPALPLAYLHLADIAFRRGDFPATVKYLTDGRPRFEGETKLTALQLLGRAEVARGNRSGAMAAYEELLRDRPNDPQSLLQLGRAYRQERRTAEAAKVLTQAQTLAPEHRSVLFERTLLARDAGDLTQERALSEELLRREPNKPELWPLRANLVSILLRQNNIADARKQLDSVIATAPANQAQSVATLRTLRALLNARDGKLDEAQRDAGGTKSAVAAIIDALAGRRDAAVRALQELTSDPDARADLGLLLWQLGRGSEAKPHLAASTESWNDVRVANGELALIDKNYERAIELLAAPCTATPPAFAVAGDALLATVGSSEPCARAKQSLATALLAAAAEDLERHAARGEVSAGALRETRQLVDRALALPLSDRLGASAHFIRGSLELLAGDTADAKEELARANALGVSGSLDQLSRGYLAAIRDNEESQREPEQISDPVSATPRRVVVAFLPDAPADDKKVAEAISALVGQLGAAAGVPLQTELFRRAEDARAFISANRERVGIIISNSEFVSEAGGFRPRFQFSRDGRQSYRRVVIVPASSKIDSLADLRGRTVSMVDGLRDAVSSSGANTTRVNDDLTAAANALYGKTDAALVSESNPLLAQHAGKLRVIHTTAANGLPVIAFGAMPVSDRESLAGALRELSARRVLAPIHMTALASLDPEPRERPQPKRIQVTAPSLAALGIAVNVEPPAKVTYRVSVPLPSVTIPDNVFE